MSASNMPIQGSIVALVTPMLEDGSIDFESFEGLVNWHIEQGTQGLVIVGTTGESGTIDDDEHFQLVERAIAVAAGRVPVIAGCGGTSTDKVCRLVKRLDQLKPAAYLSVTPYYIKPTQQGLIEHYRQIADSSDAPVILYNVPSRTACDLSNESVACLAAHKKIIGIKDAVGDVERSRQLMKMVPDEFLLLSGDDETALDFVVSGGHGVISVTSNAAPAQMQNWCDSALKGDEKMARTLFEPLIPLHRSLFTEANPIPVKYAVSKLRNINQAIRLPMTKASDESRKNVDSALAGLGLI